MAPLRTSRSFDLHVVLIRTSRSEKGTHHSQDAIAWAGAVSSAHAIDGEAALCVPSAYTESRWPTYVHPNLRPAPNAASERASSFPLAAAMMTTLETECGLAQKLSVTLFALDNSHVALLESWARPKVELGSTSNGLRLVTTLTDGVKVAFNGFQAFVARRSQTCEATTSVEVVACTPQGRALRLARTATALDCSRVRGEPHRPARPTAVGAELARLAAQR